MTHNTVPTDQVLKNLGAGFTRIALAFLVAGSSLAAADFRSTSRSIKLPEAGTITQWLIHTDAGIFGFVPPARWKQDLGAISSRLVWISPRRESITLKLKPSPATTPFDPQALLQVVTNDLPQARLLRQTTCPTESENATAFDIAWTSQDEPTLSRIAFLRIAGTAFEFHLSAPASTFNKALPSFQGLLTSFQLLSGSSLSAPADE